MALQPGSSRKVISQNIAKLVREGTPHSQAVGIVLRKAKRERPQPCDQDRSAIMKPSASELA